MKSHNETSKGVKSGDHGGHGIGPPSTIHLAGQVEF